MILKVDNEGDSLLQHNYLVRVNEDGFGISFVIKRWSKHTHGRFLGYKF